MEQTGDLEGIVVDEQDKGLPGATLNLKGPEFEGPQVTNAEGRFRFLLLPPGHYDLTAQLEGFKPAAHNDISISVGGTVKIKIEISKANE